MHNITIIKKNVCNCTQILFEESNCIKGRTWNSLASQGRLFSFIYHGLYKKDKMQLYCIKSKVKAKE